MHWWYFTNSHAAENTAGYYNTVQYDGYKDVAAMFKRNNVVFLFTCLEMKNSGQQNCECGPENLVQQTRTDAWNAGLEYSGENALYVFNVTINVD